MSLNVVKDTSLNRQVVRTLVIGTLAEMVDGQPVCFRKALTVTASVEQRSRCERVNARTWRIEWSTGASRALTDVR